MSRMVERLLRTYNEWRYLDLEGPFADFRIDLDRAIRLLPHEDQKFIYELFLRDKEPPVRTDQKGSPRGGTSQTSLAPRLAKTKFSDTAQRVEITRRKQTICAKIADYLGGDYLDVN